MLTGLISFFVIFFIFIVVMITKQDAIKRILGVLPNNTPPITQFEQQLVKTADTVLARMENEISHLEYLLAEADVKIVRLEQLLTANHGGDAVSQTVAVPADELDGEKTRTLAPPPAVDEFIQPSGAAPKKLRTMPGTTSYEQQDKWQLALALTGQGYSIAEIAKITGLGQGEVALLQQLNKK